MKSDEGDLGEKRFLGVRSAQNQPPPTVDHRYGWEPVDEGKRNHFPDSVGSEALLLAWRAELRNQGSETVTVRSWC